ncbi:MAG: RluA family pseudouridine synthase [Verrucomicrobiales bacterium]|nr:RluA family pseudouridine synthase [Verrucomicrobiales bacterium]
MKPLSILYRDQWIVAVDKPAGLPVHPGGKDENSSPILMKVLRDQIGAKIWSVHRLDQPTSGVIVFSLSKGLDTHIRLQFERQAVRKLYLAIVAGKTPHRWRSDQPLQKDETHPFRKAATDFERKQTFQIEDQSFSLLKVRPKSGRFHQIRKHLAAARFPILGDYRYGDVAEMDRLTKLTRQSGLMLHAQLLQLTHPVTSEDLFISAPVPERFSAICDC